MMVRGIVAAVSYLNTVPFVYGIEHADNLRASLLLSPPSNNAKLFFECRADVALVPVAALIDKNPNFITPYCLGTNGAVRTVVLVSNSPIEEVKNIYLDAHSLTSVMLVRVLCDEYWNVLPSFHDMQTYDIIEQRSEHDAFVLIGDKVFDYENRFGYSYDLGEHWNLHTDLPFVFAAWVAHEDVEKQFIDDLSVALRYGLEHIEEAIDYCGYSGKPYAYDYLTKNMSYGFDVRKQEALELFWSKCRRFSPLVTPG